MKDNVNKRNLEIKTALVFLITFVLAAGLTDYQNQTQEKGRKIKSCLHRRINDHPYRSSIE
ncbi:hypothetical protein LQE94_03050 [Mediterraneibacter sp. NSJ-151]|uniref:hypothetical protein n=1 Tax=Mediterraneibacter sp. NSJ-151 TaxID=2897708 RepID=UPI001F0B3636|nr:hypothetical protein [Mediterraneibacter sp. NSJ-151]MCH4279014.1 hypothetical protein [Mediterraneibacter sp. NSJ-151]